MKRILSLSLLITIIFCFSPILVLAEEEPIEPFVVYHNDSMFAYSGDGWRNASGLGGYNQTTTVGDYVTFEVTGQDAIDLIYVKSYVRSIFEIYVNDTLYDEVDAYDRNISLGEYHLPLDSGTNTIKLVNTDRRNEASTGWLVGLKGVRLNVERQESEPVPDNSNVELDLLTPSDTVNAAEEFTVDITLNNATDIYAEDIRVSYDTNLFEFVHSGVGSAGLYLYHKVETIDGSLRYIVASQGEQYGITGNEIIVRLTFRAKNVDGTGNIDITSGLVADNLGNEYTPILNSTSITVQAMNADVNRNGFVSLGDLAIAAYDYSKTTGQLANENSDVNLDEVVNDVDLTTIVDAILANE